MRKILCLLLAIFTVISLVACGDAGNTAVTDKVGDSYNESTEILDIIDSGYKIVYDLSDSNAIAVMSELQTKINEAVGVKPSSLNSGNAEIECEIQFGLKQGRAEAEQVYKEVSGYADGNREAYIIRAVGKKLVVSASDKSALKLAADELIGYAENGKFILPADIDKVVVYDAEAYLKEGKVIALDAEKIGADVSLAGIKLNGNEVVGFSPDKTEFGVAAENPSQAQIELVTAEAGAQVSAVCDGNTFVFTVKSINGKNEKVYTVKAFEKIETQVVNKGGADATVTYVIDDGDQQTATFILEKMAPKYPSLTASFALVTNKLATLDIVTNPDGTKEYAKDENGFYTYKKNESTWAFWEKAAQNKNFELVSHSHTHKYWGEDDNGGTFTYYNTAGEAFTSENFPKGSVAKEFVASKQIIQDLDPTQSASVFVRSGLSAGGKNVDYSPTFWDEIETSGAYIGARGTYTYPSTPKVMVNEFSNIMVDKVKLKSYMVQHYNTNPSVKTTQADSGPAECLAAGIPYWTNYIDEAVKMKGWAAFCIHTIRPDTHDTRSGHYIFQSQADELFAYTEKLAAENKVWVAPLCEGMAYAVEWASAKSAAYIDGDKITVSLDDEAEGADFNVALTVKTALPAGKTSASVNGAALKTVTENGKLYAYVDVVPGTSVSVDVK